MGTTLWLQNHRGSRPVGQLMMPYDGPTLILQISAPFRPMPRAPISETLPKPEPCVAAWELADSLQVYAPKGQLGHLLGAAGSVEAILGLQALSEGILPKSINADPLDPGVDLAVTASAAVKLSAGESERYMLKNAFGFGGHNISLILAAPGSTAARHG